MWKPSITSEEVLMHSAKGSHWRKHKYVKIENGRYVYKDSVTEHGGSSGTFELNRGGSSGKLDKMTPEQDRKDTLNRFVRIPSADNWAKKNAKERMHKQINREISIANSKNAGTYRGVGNNLEMKRAKEDIKAANKRNAGVYRGVGDNLYRRHQAEATTKAALSKTVNRHKSSISKGKDLYNKIRKKISGIKL